MPTGPTTLSYKRIDTGEPTWFTFGDISVLKQNLEIKYGALPYADPAVLVSPQGRVCFDPERITDVRFGQAEA